MHLSRRNLWFAISGGLIAACAVILIGARWFDNAPQTDGSFRLEEPGIFQQPVDAVNPDRSGTPLPELTLPNADGVDVALDSLVGRPMVINVWYSWCAPCARELGDFATVDAELGGAVQFVGVNPFDTTRAMVEFADERGVTYELLRDPQREFSRALDIIGYPATLFVDQQGQIVAQTGELSADELRTAIDTYLQ